MRNHRLPNSLSRVCTRKTRFHPRWFCHSRRRAMEATQRRLPQWSPASAAIEDDQASSGNPLEYERLVIAKESHLSRCSRSRHLSWKRSGLRGRISEYPRCEYPGATRLTPTRRRCEPLAVSAQDWLASDIAMLRQPSKNLFRLCGIDWPRSRPILMAKGGGNV